MRAKENWPRAVRTYAPSKVRWAALISTSLCLSVICRYYWLSDIAFGLGLLDAGMSAVGEPLRPTYSCVVSTTDRALWRRKWNLSSGWGYIQKLAQHTRWLLDVKLRFGYKPGTWRSSCGALALRQIRVWREWKTQVYVSLKQETMVVYSPRPLVVEDRTGSEVRMKGIWVLIQSSGRRCHGCYLPIHVTLRYG